MTGRHLTTTERAGFGAELSRRVDERLDPATLRSAYRRLHRKAVIVGLWYLLSFVLLFVAHGWILGALACVSLALSMVAVGFNIQHDANHNAFFPTGGRRRVSTANRLAGLSINAIGGDRKRWIDGHVILHHSAPNVVGKDQDIDFAGLARVAPEQRHRRLHTFQHLYLWVLYGMTTVMIMVGDVTGTIRESVVGDRRGRRPSPGDYAALLGSKALFLVAVLLVPFLLHPWWVVVLSAFVVLAISGWVLGIVFQLAHVVEEASFGEEADRREVKWHQWQVAASVDFCHGTGLVDRAFTWFAGGLNFQTEHHLFPHLPHTTYPLIAPVVEQTCVDWGVPYRVQPTLWAALRSHHRHVRELGRGDVLDRAA
jgi:linoleoyl-CoA desaturase